MLLNGKIRDASNSATALHRIQAEHSTWKKSKHAFSRTSFQDKHGMLSMLGPDDRIRNHPTLWRCSQPEREPLHWTKWRHGQNTAF